MATGPEHYRLAEELLAEVTRDDGSVDFGDEGEAYVAAAQVHAILALAAATALRGQRDMYDLDFEAWDRVCGVQEDDEDVACSRCCEYGHVAADCEAILDEAPETEPSARVTL